MVLLVAKVEGSKRLKSGCFSKKLVVGSVQSFGNEEIKAQVEENANGKQKQIQKQKTQA